MNNTKQSEIQVAEEKLRVAMLCSDLAALDSLLSDKLIFTNHLGQVISKADDLDGHRKGDLNIQALSLSQQQILLVAELAIVSVHAAISGSFKGMPATGYFRFTRVWENKNSQWQVVAGHSSLVV